MHEWALIIDHEACYGCLACEVACKQENGAPAGVKLIDVLEDGPRPVNGELVFEYFVRACLHAECEDKPCIDSCPVDDTLYERDDGIVVLELETCTGCEACIPECPEEAIVLDAGQMLAQKCNLCYHRVDKGLIPACADNICLAHCIYFGEPAEIQERIAANRPGRARSH